MRGSLAAYDPSLSTPTGDFWAWRSQRVPRATLEQYHAAIEAGHSLEQPNALKPGDLHGGAFANGDDWCCFYRIYDGGRDLRGRPGRFVLVCCFVDRTDAQRHDWSRILDSPPFASVNVEKIAAGQTPVPPADLDLEIAAPQFVNSSVDSLPHRQVWRECVVANRPFHWKVRRQDNQMTEVIEWLQPIREPRGKSPDDFAPSTSRTIKPSRRTIPWPSRRASMKYVLLAALILIGMFAESRLHWLARLPGSSDDTSVDLPAMRRFLESYQDPFGHDLIPAGRLLDRMKRGDWSPEAGDNKIPASATMPMKDKTNPTQSERLSPLDKE